MRAEVEKGRPLQTTRKKIGLMVFLRGTSTPADMMPGCANFDHRYGGCLYADFCLVQDDKRCNYFEQAVLPTAIDLGLLGEITTAYRRHMGLEEKNLSGRKCPECGAILKPRRRFCDDCRERRNRESKRNWKRK